MYVLDGSGNFKSKSLQIAWGTCPLSPGSLDICDPLHLLSGFTMSEGLTIPSVQARVAPFVVV